MVRIRRSHRRGLGSIPGQGTQLMHLLLLIVRGLLVEATMPLTSGLIHAYIWAYLSDR